MKIVFLGDSITDCGRDKTDAASLGGGFVKILSDKLTRLYPDMELEILNRGVDGDRLCDLLARAERDATQLNPDVAVVMIGINDALCGYSGGGGIDLKLFRRDLAELIGKLKSSGAAVIFLEPFLLPVPDKPGLRELFEKETEVINEVCIDMCDEYIAYDEILNGVTYSAPYSDYAADGIHPTRLCARLIADTAIKALQKHILK